MALTTLGTIRVRLAAETAEFAAGMDAARKKVASFDQNIGKFGNSSKAMASGLEAIARAGQVTGDGLKQVIEGGSQVIAMFGPQGALVSAVSITGLAIYDHITNRMKEAREEIRKTSQEIANMANTGNTAGLQQKLREAAFGLPFDKNDNLVPVSSFAKGAFQGSLADLEGHYAHLQTLIPPGATMVSGQLATELKDVVSQLDVARDHFKKLKEALLNVAEQPASIGTLPALTSTALSPEAIAKARAAADKAEAERIAAFEKILNTSYPSLAEPLQPFNPFAGPLKAVDLSKAKIPQVDTSIPERRAFDIQTGAASIVNAGFSRNGASIGSSVLQLGASVVGGAFAGPIGLAIASGLGGVLGGLFGKHDKEVQPPILKGLDAIERAQRDTITTISAQTDALLNPENRAFNLPSSFNIPAYTPFPRDTTIHVTINAQNTKVSADELRRLAVDAVTEALGTQRRNSSWTPALRAA